MAAACGADARVGPAPESGGAVAKDVPAAPTEDTCSDCDPDDGPQDEPDPGLQPEPDVGPSCTDLLHNGDEAGMDCGGSCDSPCFDAEPVDKAGIAGLHVRAAVGKKRAPHLAYITDYQSGGTTCCGLRHAQKDGDSWVFATVTTDVSKGALDLAVTSEGRAGVAYHNAQGAVVMALRPGQTQWNETVVDAEAGDAAPAMVLSPGGNASLGWARTTEAGQECATGRLNPAGELTTESTGVGGESIHAVDIGRDGLAVLHAICTVKGDAGWLLVHTARKGVSWSTPVEITAVAADPGRPALALADVIPLVVAQKDGALRLWSGGPDGWKEESLGGGGSGPYGLVIGPEGGTWAMWTEGGVTTARKTPNGWVGQVLTDFTPPYAAMLLDAAGLPAVGYHAGGEDGLRYAFGFTE